MRGQPNRDRVQWGRGRQPMARRAIPRFRPAGRAERRRFVTPEAWPRPPAPRAGQLPGIARGLGASGLVHLLLAAIIVLASLDRPSSGPEMLPPPAIEMVFENAGAPEQPSAPDSEVAPQVSIPAPGAPPSVPAPPAPQQPPMPPPTAPPPPQLAAPQVQQPPQPPRPPAPPAPQMAQAVPELPLPPPPPPPTPPQPQRAEPRVTPVPAPPQPNPQPNRLPGIYMPEAFAALSRPPAPPSRPGQPRRGLDLSLPALAPPGRNSAEPQAEIRGANVGPDWRNAFRRWLDEHLRYPRDAAEFGEDGTVRVRIISEPDGRVRSVSLIGPSRSVLLNAGTQQPFRGARIPAFPPGSDPNGVTVDLTVNYVLIRR